MIFTLQLEKKLPHFEKSQSFLKIARKRSHDHFKYYTIFALAGKSFIYLLPLPLFKRDLCFQAFILILYHSNSLILIFHIFPLQNKLIDYQQHFQMYFFP